uniref:Uncharacterized protein n=1 Tax=Musa acuminata subsp. malaccensis TaxID=214687 RepID=A0A804JCF2_MUSAM
MSLSVFINFDIDIHISPVLNITIVSAS